MNMNNISAYQFHIQHTYNHFMFQQLNKHECQTGFPFCRLCIVLQLCPNCFLQHVSSPGHRVWWISADTTRWLLGCHPPKMQKKHVVSFSGLSLTTNELWTYRGTAPSETQSLRPGLWAQVPGLPPWTKWISEFHSPLPLLETQLKSWPDIKGIER